MPVTYDISLAGTILESLCSQQGIHTQFLISFDPRLRTYRYEAPFPPTVLPPLPPAPPPIWSVNGVGETGVASISGSLLIPDDVTPVSYSVSSQVGSLFSGCSLPVNYSLQVNLSGRVLANLYLLATPLSPPLPPPPLPLPPPPVVNHVQDLTWPAEFHWPLNFQWPYEQKVFRSWYYRIFYSGVKLPNLKSLPEVTGTLT